MGCCNSVLCDESEEYTTSEYLCEDLIVEIFTRLPSKSLLRFRSLSKSLCSCISSPSFISMHTLQSPQKILFTHLYNDKIKEEGFYTLHGEDELSLLLCPKRGYIGITTTVPFSTDFETIGPCNGTLCVRTKEGFCLWNPSIQRKLYVPECPRKYELRASEQFGSPEAGFGGIGFGFDPVSDDYKIVWISYAKDSTFVYAVKTGTWCEIASPKPEISQSSYSLLSNGMLHWKVHDRLERYHLTSGYGYILTFDLSTNVFGRFSLPKPHCYWRLIGLTTIQDSLALIYTHVDATRIYVRRDSSWSVAFEFNTHELLVTEALQLQPTNHDDLLLKVLGEGIQVYNSKTGVRSRAVNFNVDSGLVYFQPCVETLHLLDMGETICEKNPL